MDKKVYIVSNLDNRYSRAIVLTEEQAKAINWFIEFADLEYSCEEPNVYNTDVIE